MAGVVVIFFITVRFLAIGILRVTTVFLRTTVRLRVWANDVIELAAMIAIINSIALFILENFPELVAF